MNMTQLPAPVRRALSLIAVPGWMLLIWKAVEVIHTLSFVRENFGGFFSWVSSPTGNLLTILVGLVWIAVVAFWQKEESPVPEKMRLPSKRQVWFFSPGICLSLNRSASTVFVTLQILSTEQTELTHVRIDLRDTNKGTSITCENSEPMTIERLVPTAKLIQQKVTPQELEGFVPGSMVQLNGYAKFRDGTKITQTPITIVTILSR